MKKLSIALVLIDIAMFVFAYFYAPTSMSRPIFWMEFIFSGLFIVVGIARYPYHLNNIKLWNERNIPTEFHPTAFGDTQAMILMVTLIGNGFITCLVVIGKDLF